MDPLRAHLMFAALHPRLGFPTVRLVKRVIIQWRLTRSSLEFGLGRFFPE